MAEAEGMNPLTTVREGQPFELPDGRLARVEVALLDGIYLGFADHGQEVSTEWLAAQGYRVEAPDA